VESGIIKYSQKEFRDYAEAHKTIVNMRRKPKLGFLIPSINRYYGYRGLYIATLKRVGIQKFIFPESRVFLEFMKMKAKKKIKHKFPKGTDIELYVRIYYPDNRRVDVDNPKAIMDSLSGILYDDDSQVVKLTTLKFMKQGRGRVSISWKIRK